MMMVMGVDVELIAHVDANINKKYIFQKIMKRKEAPQGAPLVIYS
jgi:hypothetical protein